MKQFFILVFLATFTSGAAEFWQSNNPAVFVVKETPPTNSTGRPVITREFVHYLPNTLNYAIWTNLMVLTNTRSPQIWAERSHPLFWPSSKPKARWNTNSIVYGMQGFTALSPCWEGEGAPGCVPITALTRRHGYKCGHGSGANGFHKAQGQKVWFVTPQNEVVERRIERYVVRYSPGFLTRTDYMIVLFDRDLPSDIEPLSVVHPDSLTTNYPNVSGSPWTLLKTEQQGNASLDLPGWRINTWKGGDSGSPDLLVLPGKLVFVDGRSSTPATPDMQRDMDELCRLEGLEPAKYQLNWEKLSARWPSQSH